MVREEEAFRVELGAFSGPLDVLLDLARRQKVDLAGISVVALAEQYLAWLESLRGRRLALAAEYLVMAAWLVWLRSQLLLPAPERAPEADREAEGLRERLAALEAVRRAARWLEERPQLHRERLPRGAGERLPVRHEGPVVADLPSLVGAWFRLAVRAERGRVVRLPPRRLWSPETALEHIYRRLTGREWHELAAFLPPFSCGLERRAALASGLVACLELARRGEVELRQPRPFGPLFVRRLA
ncbi:Segregation and condensation protein A [bacterium HR39]|nr:Segregation and condensation protein A [bacterium HR39]